MRKIAVVYARSHDAYIPIIQLQFSRENPIASYPMRSAILLRVSRTLTTRSSTVFLSRGTYVGKLSTLNVAMDQGIFKGHSDHNGITIDSAEEACDNKIFAQRLKGRDAFRPSS